MNIIMRMNYKVIPSESEKVSVIMIASIGVAMSFNVSPCESVMRSLFMSLSAEFSRIYNYKCE